MTMPRPGESRHGVPSTDETSSFEHLSEFLSMLAGMSGGIDPRSQNGATLGERVPRTAGRQEDTPGLLRTPAVSTVLVDGTTPGLISRWRRAAGGWEGLVATVSGADDFTAQWLPAARIAPVRMDR